MSFVVLVISDALSRPLGAVVLNLDIGVDLTLLTVDHRAVEVHRTRNGPLEGLVLEGIAANVGIIVTGALLIDALALEHHHQLCRLLHRSVIACAKLIVAVVAKAIHMSLAVYQQVGIAAGGDPGDGDLLRSVALAHLARHITRSDGNTGIGSQRAFIDIAQLLGIVPAPGIQSAGSVQSGDVVLAHGNIHDTLEVLGTIVLL